MVVVVVVMGVTSGALSGGNRRRSANYRIARPPLALLLWQRLQQFMPPSENHFHFPPSVDGDFAGKNTGCDANLVVAAAISSKPSILSSGGGGRRGICLKFRPVFVVAVDGWWHGVPYSN